MMPPNKRGTGRVIVNPKLARLTRYELEQLCVTQEAQILALKGALAAVAMQNGGRFKLMDSVVDKLDKFKITSHRTPGEASQTFVLEEITEQGPKGDDPVIVRPN